MLRIFRDITAFTVYATSYDFEKSFNFDTTVADSRPLSIV